MNSDGTTKQVRLSVREIMTLPSGRKVVLRFNSELQPIGDEAGLLSGYLGILGSTYAKLPICKESWRHVSNKDKVYTDCVKTAFHFDEDSEGIIKHTILKSMGKSWKETRNKLFKEYYDATKMLAQNVTDHRPQGIDEDHWRLFLEYRLKPETQEKCRKNAENRSKQLYTHTGGSKSLARRRDEESKSQGRRVSRGEIWAAMHKRSDGSYIHEQARAVSERIAEIEQQDESSRLLSQNDSLAQALGREHSSRVRGMGFGPTPSQLFGTNLSHPGDGSQIEATQRVLNDIQAELAAKKMKRKAVEDEVAAEKMKRKAVEDEVAAEKIKIQTMESALRYLLQRQGGELPPEITAGMKSLDR